MIPSPAIHRSVPCLAAVSACCDADAARGDAAAAAGGGGLQINGVDVRTREQAIRMFADSRDEITLLLARPLTQVTHTHTHTGLCH